MPSKITCIHCESSDNTRYKNYEWRPAHDFDKLVQVIYRRVFCAGCGRSFAILPDEIVNAFQYTFPTQQGPGISVFMLLFFVSLIPKGILMARFRMQ